MTYLVLECHLSYAVVLSEDGRFLKAANLRYQVGQTVTDIIEMQLPPKTDEKPARRWLYPLVAMAACMVLLSAGLLQLWQAPHAFVYMTINPQVRIDVNRSDRVVGLAGVNEEGEALIEAYGYRRKTLEQVVDDLADRAIAQGYLQDGGKISLTLESEDTAWAARQQEALPTRLGKHLEERMAVAISVTTPTPQEGTGAQPAQPGESEYGNSDYEGPGESGSSAPPQPGDSGYGDTPYSKGETDHGTSSGATDWEPPEKEEGPSPYREPEPKEEPEEADKEAPDEPEEPEEPEEEPADEPETDAPTDYEGEGDGDAGDGESEEN